ncbi:hypothetical protein OHA21_18205 [Actinoplanes sp. NBC_00393]|uniref:hypothetical protein n=1 Tax=Actinoplanes sp. NBC_00393 TaxID=2975953 RepID=UPI002E1DBF1A
MLWPVLLDSSPRDTVWSLGERVSTRLRWLDEPDLSDDLVLHRTPVRTSALRDCHGEPWAQLVESGDLRAVREGDQSACEITLSGCLGFDAFLGIIGELPVTVGIVRRVRLVQDLHERGADQWMRRPGGVRLIDVPDAGPQRLIDDPSLFEPMPPDWEPEPGTVQFMSPEQHFRMVRDKEQWQARGFLVDLEVGASGG